MKSITIHNLDDQLEKKLTEKAKHEHLSLNKTIQTLLRSSLGLDPEPARREAFRDLCGVWTPEEGEAFDSNISDMTKVNPDDWK